jgi:hypothetical protein
MQSNVAQLHRFEMNKHWHAHRMDAGVTVVAALDNFKLGCTIRAQFHCVTRRDINRPGGVLHCQIRNMELCFVFALPLLQGSERLKDSDMKA